MTNKRILLFLLSPVILILLSSWGYLGHQKINGGITIILPQEMAFLIPGWTDIVRLHASDADYRKETDPDEAPRHYIDIDNYPEFLETGMIHHNLDTMIALYGYSFVLDQGILPWATVTAYDSMVACIARLNWNRAGLFAADLGHYVGDGHMPLHLTRNYNGQYTGQSGVHSRYESKMVGRYEDQLNIVPDSCQYIGNVKEFIFTYIYANYQYVDSILLADQEAATIAGNTVSDLYYGTLWEHTGAFTRELFQKGSRALASLIYTGWIEAGSPHIDPNGLEEPEANQGIILLPPHPNPAVDQITFTVTIILPEITFSIRIYDATGRIVTTIADTILPAGTYRYDWHPDRQGGGVCYCVLEAGGSYQVRELIFSE
ncbi:MAG: hypothetical protein JXA23_09590 [Bacteroidales bacterium]|nr:hypothetical protein [Bacteroidales bacterium]